MPKGHKYGDTHPVLSVAKASGTTIAIGDLIYRDGGASNVPKPAASLAWDTSLAVTQETFHDSFLGVALSAGRSADTDKIRIATSGIFEFDCASATFAAGALVGPAKQSGNALESQKVVSVATANLAIGRVEQDYTSATTRVRVRVMSVVHDGGAYAPA